MDHSHLLLWLGEINSEQHKKSHADKNLIHSLPGIAEIYPKTQPNGKNINQQYNNFINKKQINNHPVVYIMALPIKIKIAQKRNFPLSKI